MKRVWIVGLVALAGCGPREVTKFNATQPPPPNLAGDWRVHEMKDINATIAAPTEWRLPSEGSGVIDMSQFGGEGQAKFTDEQMKNDLKLPDDLIKQTHEDEKLPEGTSLLLNKRIVGETAYITQIELKHKTVPGGTTLKAQADEVGNIYMGESGAEKIELPVGPAMVIKKQTKSMGGEVGHHIHYILVNNEDVYVITLQTEQDASMITDIAQQVAESFRLKK